MPQPFQQLNQTGFILVIGLLLAACLPPPKPPNEPTTGQQFTPKPPNGPTTGQQSTPTGVSPGGSQTCPLATQARRGVSRVAPILRLETEMHTAMITRADVDAAERYLVTASHDKTVRVWSLAEGRLLRVLRPPIGDGDEGKVHAVAISPDGQKVAVGGNIGKPGQDNKFIYLFNRATGELCQRLTGLPSEISYLSYSPNGRYLVASLKQGGIRIYRTSDYSLHAKDTDYGGISYWADFDTQGRLVTSCYDGYIRLYDNQFQLLTKSKTPDGRQPYAVRFSPTGEKIAVGFQDTAHISVLSGTDLKLLYRPKTPGMKNVNLSIVAWSQTGQWLYAGGTYWNGKNRLIWRWAKAGQGRSEAWPASSNTLMDIHALRDGSIIFTAADPAFGRLNANGQKRFERQANMADFRGIFKKEGLLLSNNSRIVRFSYEFMGERPAYFLLDERLLSAKLSKGLQRLPTLTPPRTQALGLNVTDWENRTTPKLNGSAILLKPNEMARSLAITPDGQHALLGADWSLRLFDKQGQQQWEIPVPGTVWGVNIAETGKIAVAALADGTLRWYRLSDGQELLALFPHSDDKRWILWTPQGDYAASPGAEQLMGWHIDNGLKQAADFFPAARFRDNYYRPDVIAKVLDTLNPDEARRLANEEAERPQPQPLQQQLPPVVTLLSPQDGATFSDSNIKLRYRLRSPSDKPITDIKVLIDGRPLKEVRGLERLDIQQSVNESEQSLQITVPQRDVEVGLIAENEFAASEPATVQLRWQGQQPTEFVIKPKLYLLAIGVSDYQNNRLDLSYADKDAQDLSQLLKAQKGLYREVSVKLLTSASKGDILDGLDWIERETTQHDVAIVFFAGHGVNDNKGRYYFLPREVDTERLKRTGIAYYEVRETVSTLAGKALFFVDTCHSGNVMGARRGVGDVDQIANDLAAAENGVVVFASSTGKQFSQENARWQNGAFTEALLEGLSGKADYTKDGAISINELDLYLSERVKKLTDGAQTPTTTKPKTIPDFPIVWAR
jgi:WD40 repeat protein